MQNDKNHGPKNKQFDQKEYINNQIDLIEVKKVANDYLKSFAVVFNRGLLDFLYKMVPVNLALYHQHNYSGIDIENKIDRTLQAVYVREHLTTYNSQLFIGNGEVQERNLVNEYRKAVFTKIANVYPELLDECNRQFEIWKTVKDQQELFEELAK